MSSARLYKPVISIALIAVLLLCVYENAGAAGLSPNSSRECAICHIRWVEALVKNGDQGDVSSVAPERQAGREEMCMSCHDGSVVDSRFKVWSTKHHTTDAVPSPRVKIPTDIFPLDSCGRMTCATCHTAHAVPDDTDMATAVFLRQPNVDSSLCLSCHPEHAQKNDLMHPLGKSDQPIPAVILEAGGKTSADGNRIICQTCHEPHGAKNDRMLVLPPSKLCIACHDDKRPETEAEMPFHRIGKTYEGFEPPPDLIDEGASFGPAGELSCLSCHRLHDASGAWPLLITNNDDSSLCLECHEREAAIIDSAHDLRVSSPETLNSDGLKASQSGPCGSCHLIHGWARDIPKTDRPHSSGCMECHQTGGPGAENRPYKEAHPTAVPLPQKMSTQLPVDAATGKIGCLTCHDPHLPIDPAVKSDGLQEADIPAPRSFLRAEGSKLCILCHSSIAESLEGAHDPAAFDVQYRRRLAVHKSAGPCRVCHSTHNAKGPHLWSRPPAEPTGDPVADLCNSCHDEKILPSPRGTNHPFVDPNLMAKIDVGHKTPRPALSGMGCAACHDPHGGKDNTAQLHKPIGKLCVGCHVDKLGAKGSIHDPSKAVWAQDLFFESKDVCIDCHQVHGHAQSSGVWSALAASKRSCLACHSNNGPGKAVETPHFGKILHEGEGIGIKPQDDSIVCGSCHDIHKTEQHAMLLKNSRRDSALCLDCHPESAAVINTPHDLRTSAPDVRNVRGETPAEGGPCSSCHIIHSANGSGTWALGSMDSRDFGSSLCTCCHRPGGCAERRIPKHTSHPQVTLHNRTVPQLTEFMPTFDEHGNHSQTGSISCLTCHETHTGPAGRATAPEAEKNRLNKMFLRPTKVHSLCMDCHGIETIWRYLYYHKDNRNPFNRSNGEERTGGAGR